MTVRVGPTAAQNSTEAHEDHVDDTKVGNTSNSNHSNIGIDLVDLNPKANKIGATEVLEPFSKWEVKNLLSSSILPYQFPATQMRDEGVRNLSEPVFIIKDQKVPFARQTQTVFRAIVYLPEDAQVKSIKKFDLVLNHVSKFSPQALENETQTHTLAGQVLCTVSSAPICSGDVDQQQTLSVRNPLLTPVEKYLKNTFFATQKVEPKFKILPLTEEEKAAGKVDVSGVVSTADEIVLPMSDLLGVPLEESLKWIRSYGSKHAEGGYYKLNFVVGPATTLESGKIVLELDVGGIPTVVSVPLDLDTVHGVDDTVKGVLGGDTQEVSATENMLQ